MLATLKNNRKIISFFIQSNFDIETWSSVDRPVENKEKIQDFVKWKILKLKTEIKETNWVFQDNSWLWYMDDDENRMIEESRNEVDTILNDILKYNDSDLGDEIKKDLVLQLKEYNLMFNWLWDHYEIWASASRDGQESNEKVTERLIDIMTDEEVLLYLIDVNFKIDENDYQSDKVSSTYISFTQSLNKKILEKLKNSSNKERNKNLLAFANIVSWRNCVISQQNYEVSLDNDMKDQETAETALHHVFYQKWWAIDKAVSSWKIEIKDDVVWDTPPAKIVDDFKEVVWEDKFKSFEKYVINIKGDTRYAELDIEKKVFIWMLARFLESGDQTMEALMNWMLEAQKEVSDSIENEVDSWFWSVEPEDLWLNSWTIEYEAFELYRDIIWAWYFNPSDTSWNNSKTAGKVTWVIWATIATAVASPIIFWAWAIATWTIAWVSSVIAWKTMFGEWHDTSKEAFLDWASDLSLSALLWGLWWKLYAWIKWVSSNMSGGNALQWWSVIGAEAIAWAWLELWRQKTLWKDVDRKEVTSMAWLMALLWVWLWVEPSVYKKLWKMWIGKRGQTNNKLETNNNIPKRVKIKWMFAPVKINDAVLKDWELHYWIWLDKNLNRFPFWKAKGGYTSLRRIWLKKITSIGRNLKTDDITWEPLYWEFEDSKWNWNLFRKSNQGKYVIEKIEIEWIDEFKKNYGYDILDIVRNPKTLETVYWVLHMFTRKPFWKWNGDKFYLLEEVEWKKIVDWLSHSVDSTSWKPLYWKFKDLNWNWFPFKLWDKGEHIIEKIKIEWVEEIISCNTFRDKAWKIIWWFFKNQKWNEFPFWFDWSKYVALKEIEWKKVINTRKVKMDENTWKLFRWEFEDENWKWFPFEGKSTIEIEWVNKLIGENSIKRNENGDIIYGFCEKEEWFSFFFWLEWDTYVTLKIEWVNNTNGIRNFRINENTWKPIHWEFEDERWVFIPFRLEWDTYVRLKIEWVNDITDIRNLEIDRNTWKPIYWEFEDERWVFIPFRLEWDTYVRLKIEWVNNTNGIRNFRINENTWKPIYWEFRDGEWNWLAFKSWGQDKYIVEKIEIKWFGEVHNIWVIKRNPKTWDIVALLVKNQKWETELLLKEWGSYTRLETNPTTKSMSLYIDNKTWEIIGLNKAKQGKQVKLVYFKKNEEWIFVEIDINKFFKNLKNYSEVLLLREFHLN